jgi:hypothetical protein
VDSQVEGIEALAVGQRRVGAVTDEQVANVEVAVASRT